MLKIIPKSSNIGISIVFLNDILSISIDFTHNIFKSNFDINTNQIQTKIFKQLMVHQLVGLRLMIVIN